MIRKFNLNEFSFSDDDLDTPDTLMECLRRMEPSQINASGYATKLYQAVTNQNSFSSDAWCAVSFPDSAIKPELARRQLQTFIASLAEWHQTYGVEQQFLPDILADSFYVTDWVQEDLTSAGMAPGQLTFNPSGIQNPIEVSHSRLSM